VNQALVSFRDVLEARDDFLADVLEGLGRRPRSIAPKYFYDRAGSELFERICALPEYYLTRTELAILRAHAGDIAQAAGPECVLFELGSGASHKVRLLLEALRPRAYVGIDISGDFLLGSCRRLAADYPWLRVHAMCADLCDPLPDQHLPSGRRVAFFPGSSIGNFDPPGAREFLRHVRDLLGPEGALLIGVDLKKDVDVLHAAYNDAAGVTGEFNRNLLRRMRRELGARLDPDGFRHHAFYNDALGRVEMHLQAVGPQTIRIGEERFDFGDGETIHTENSWKYSVDEFAALAAQAGLGQSRCWRDPAERFAVMLLRPEDPA